MWTGGRPSPGAQGPDANGCSLQLAGAERESAERCLAGTARGVKQDQLDTAARGEYEEHLAVGVGGPRVRVSSWMERGRRLQPAGAEERLRVAGQAARRGGGESTHRQRSSSPGRRACTSLGESSPGRRVRGGGESARRQGSRSPERTRVGGVAGVVCWPERLREIENWIWPMRP
nr:unnamed protein product [Digitaria exilis]